MQRSEAETGNVQGVHMKEKLKMEKEVQAKLRKRVHTPIVLIFYFAFFSAPLGAEFCIIFTSTLFKEAATKQRQTNFKHTFNLSKTDATTLQSQF